MINDTNTAAAASHGQILRAGSGFAIACMTRASRAGSIATGRRSCWTTRCTTSSSCSNMLGLSQVTLELLARALHAHLERRDAGAGQLRDRFVLQILDVLQQERLAVLGREACEGAIHCVCPFQAFALVGAGGALQGTFVSHVLPAPP